MTEHPPGKDYSASTYSNHKCRCDRCRAAHRAYTAKRRQKYGRPRSERAWQRSTRRAAAWVREHHPEVWREIYGEQYRKAAYDK